MDVGFRDIHPQELPIGTLIGHKVQIGHLVERVPDLVVDGAQRDVAAAEMYDRDVENEGGAGDGQQFIPVAEKNDRVRPHLLENPDMPLDNPPSPATIASSSPPTPSIGIWWRWS